MPFRITKQVEIDAGHRVPAHNGKCRNLHGHRYRIVAELEIDDVIKEGSSSGMVMDFSDIKAILTEYIHDRFDHTLILWRKDPLLTVADHLFEDMLDSMSLTYMLVPEVPTAENLAKLWYFTVLAALLDRNVPARLVSIGVWETPTSYAEYKES